MGEDEWRSAAFITDYRSSIYNHQGFRNVFVAFLVIGQKYSRPNMFVTSKA